MQAWVGLGANLGDRRLAIERAIDSLRTLPLTRLTARSRLYASPPLEAQGPDYLNAVVRLETTLAPRELLDRLQAIEARAGRLRPFPNAPRTLDLDLLLVDDRVVDEPGLRLPHPRMHLRAFVLRPLADIDPDASIPGHGTVRQCLPTVASHRCDPIG